MNILYLSRLSGASYAGPTYSVPKQIEAQSKIDNVFWYNACKSGKSEWKKLSYYHDLSEFPEESIYKLPEPFNCPDLIVVELFYNMTTSKLRKELVKGEIPYTIIPRGELTRQAQTRKSFKKQIANILICNKYARKATAIQYLTEQECKDSGDKWNNNSIIISNGIDMPKNKKIKFTEDGIRCVSIGRIEPYQKGLDMLIDACLQLKDDLEKSKCTIDIYGPDVDGKKEELERNVKGKKLDKIIRFYDGVYGEEKEKVLLAHDVFLIPSRFEGHPMALIEALSYGLPCIVTTGSNMRNEVEEYGAGWTADNTVESIVGALRTMIEHKSSFNDITGNALSLAKEYMWYNIADISSSEYKKLIKE